MTSLEIAAVVSFPFAYEVSKICTSLLVTVKDGDKWETIKLAHFTVKEFLIVQQTYDEGPYWYKFTTQLAHCCITEQLIHCIFSSPKPFTNVLLEYAEEFWLAHAKQNDATTDWAETQLRVDCILTHDNIFFQDWLSLHHPSELCAQSSLYYASLLGLKASVMNLWRKLLPCENEDEILGSTVTTAARMGHVEIVRWLVKQRQDIVRYIDLPRIVECLQVNIRETLCGLLRKGSKPSLTAAVVYAATNNTSGEIILEVLLDQDLVTLAITEDIVEAAAYNHWNRKILDLLVRRQLEDFPISLRSLQAVAKTSFHALKMLHNHRKDDMEFKGRDHFDLALETSVFTIQKFLSHGVVIPVTLTLLKAIAESPYGSDILKLQLQKQSLSREENSQRMAGRWMLDVWQPLSEPDRDDHLVIKDSLHTIAVTHYHESPEDLFPLLRALFEYALKLHTDLYSTLGRSELYLLRSDDGYHLRKVGLCFQNVCAVLNSVLEPCFNHFENVDELYSNHFENHFEYINEFFELIVNWDEILGTSHLSSYSTSNDTPVHGIRISLDGIGTETMVMYGNAKQTQVRANSSKKHLPRLCLPSSW